MHTEKAIELDNRHIPMGPYGKKLYKPKALCTQLTTQLPQFLIILKKKNHETLKLLNIQMPFNENLCTNKHMTQAITQTLSNSFYVNKYYIIRYLVVPQ
jgi:hypothetical protein